MTAEQRARELLRRMDVPGARDMTTGDVVELANLYARIDELEGALRLLLSEMVGNSAARYAAFAALPPRITTHCQTISQCGTHGCRGSCKL